MKGKVFPSQRGAEDAAKDYTNRTGTRTKVFWSTYPPPEEAIIWAIGQDHFLTEEELTEAGINLDDGQSNQT